MPSCDRCGYEYSGSLFNYWAHQRACRAAIDATPVSVEVLDEKPLVKDPREQVVTFNGNEIVVKDPEPIPVIVVEEDEG